MPSVFYVFLQQRKDAVEWKADMEKFLSVQTGKKVQISSVVGVGGGSINRAYRLKTTAGIFFTKLNSASRYPAMFETESGGLALLSEAGTLNVPAVIGTGTSGNLAFLVLQWVETGTPAEDFWEDFGRRLARLHQHTAARFGLDYNNYIGSLPQRNLRHDTWESFFIAERLQPQMIRAYNDGLLDKSDLRAFDNFFHSVGRIFPEEPPALLHGDLWSGNFMVNHAGKAVLIDPAVYYGHREMDLGMSKLFGGFHNRFYRAYHQEKPLAPGWEKRLDFCNLYPLLVHVNLFGGSYTNDVRNILKPFY